MPVNYDLYHPKWSLIRRLILERARHRCEWCAAANYKPHPITHSRVVLTVAHLDHDRNHNKFTNLAALCQRCHLACDLNMHIRNRKYGRYHKEKQLNLFTIAPKPFACPQFKVAAGRLPLPSPIVKVPPLLLFPDPTAKSAGADHGEVKKAS